VVHRHLIHSRCLVAAVTALVLALALALVMSCLSLLFVGSADAANRRVAISQFAWSNPEPTVDLGERVTWYWTGPDLLHSVTGTGTNASGIDSDLGSSSPLHDVGDAFSHTFTSPGVYQFICKFHGSLPGGTVTVSGTPGDPDTEVDPVPPNNVDAVAPRLGGLRLASRRFGMRGTELSFALDERATITAEIWQVRKGRVGRFAGWQEWPAFIGFNWLEFGKPTRRFKPRPGRYRAFVYALDDWNNESRPGVVDFTIR
jgi:plastocyanin